jgi:hypothetical protein
MGKPAPGPSHTWTGTSGNDVKTVASLTELKTYSYNAGAGYDTLDLSAPTTGVSLQISAVTQGNRLVPHSILWPDSPFHGSWWSWDPLAQVGAKLTDSILNFERVIGTSGNDHISSGWPVTINTTIDGGAGDDALGGGRIDIGGVGSDQLSGGRSSDLFIGGTFDGVHATPDGTMDEFTLSGGIVLDFEVGVDRLYLETSSYTLSSWVDVTTPYGTGAQIHLTQPNDDRTVTLIGVSASTMNQLPIGFDTISGAQNTSGPGDDFFYDKYTTASTYTFGTGSGHDIIVGFDVNLDKLQLPDAYTATNTTYHGDAALLLTFDDGQSSVLLDGLTTADLPNLFG